MKLTDFILLPREKRVGHIDLSTPCEFGNGHRDKSVLLDFLDIEDDVPNWTTARIHRCHLCECGRGKGWCVNPRHFYFGTASENQKDTSSEWRKERSRKAGAASRGTPWDASKKQRFMEEYPTVKHLSIRKLGEMFGVSHTTAKRWAGEFTSS